MKVQIEFLGLPTVAKIVGVAQKIEFGGGTIGDLIAHLIKRYGAGVEQVLVDNEKKLNPYILVVINEELIAGRDDREHHQLSEGDNITFTIMAEGG